MTKLRALHGALVCGATLAIGATAQADVANYMINPGSSQSNVDDSCVGALPGATGEDCSYNAIDLWGTAAWIGPVKGSTYYANGSSPFDQNPGANPLPQGPTPDPDSVSLAVTGSLVIDDKNTGSCDADDTISGRFEIAAGTRAFAGGPGTWGEESWGDNTIVYILPESVPDFANAIAEGCEYIFGSQGFPSFIETQGLSPAGIQTYPVDLVIGSDPINPNPPDNEQDAWAGPEPGGIGVGQFEGANFQGNFGVEVSIDQNALTNGSWQCVDNFGDPSNPPVPSACNFTPAADGTPCSATGSHFCGVRAVQENWVIRIVVAPNGDILDDAYIFANNESIVFAVPPAPDRNNSWDGPVITFTATCTDCSIAKADNYSFVTGATNPVSLPIGANDDPVGVLDDTNTALIIDAPGPTRGTCDVSANNPGDVTQIACNYDSNDGFASAGTDTFTYTIDDSLIPAEQATVTITVADDTAPVANDYPIDFDSQGVAPATLRNTTDVVNDVAGNSGGNNPVVTIASPGTQGTAEVDGTEITYTANADFFQGTDSFQYTITDDNFGSPGVAPESDTGTATVTIPNVVPTTTDVETEVDAGSSVDISAVITAGNGTVDQHTVASSCDNGDLVVNSVGVNGAVVQVDATYTPDDGFSGEDTCTYTVTDEDGAGDAVDGIVTITVTESGIVVKLPGAGSALDPWSLALLLLAPLFPSRRTRRTVKTQGWLTVCVLGLVSVSGGVYAQTTTLKLQSAVSFSSNAPAGSPLTIESTGDDWTYDEAALVLTAGAARLTLRQQSGTVWFFTNDSLGTTIDISGSGTASATEYQCIEGTFGGFVFASLCGNYNFGTDNINDSTVVYGPGTTVTRTLAGDDVAIGLPQSIAQLDGFAIVTDDETTLLISNEVPATSGYEYTFAKVGEANADDYTIAQGSTPASLDIGANDRHWNPNATLLDTASGTLTGAGTDGGTFSINQNADTKLVTATYTPVNAGYLGTETWTYTVTDTEGALTGQTDIATVTVTVAPPGSADDDTGDTTRLRAEVVIPIGINDVGFSDPSTATETIAATQGTVTINNSPGPTAAITATYLSTAPLGSASYVDTFTYQMTDGLATDTALVTVNVNNVVPVANDLGGIALDTQGVSPADVSVDISVGNPGDIAGNDIGDAPSVVTTAPTNDVTTAINGAVITITAAAFTSAGDAVGYTITDADTEADTGTIAVSIPDVTPTVQDAQETVDFATSLTITLAFQPGNGAVSDHTLDISQPQLGTVTDVMVDAATSQLSFLYTATDVGIETLTVDLRDGDGSVGSGAVTITIPDDVPQVQSISQNIAFAGGAEIMLVSQLGTGAASDHTVSVTGAQWGTVSDVELNATGTEISFTYTPAGFAATDVLTASLTDANDDVGSGTATLTITGSAVTIPPQDSLPGSGSSSALSPIALLGLVLTIPLLRERRRKR